MRARWSTPCTSSPRADVAASAVLAIAFGGPTRPEDIRPFLANVLRGRPVPPARLEEVVHHYEVIGGRSPMNPLTFAQARALEAALAGAGTPLPVYVGMRNWDPYLRDTLRRMADDGVREAVGLILAPHATEASRSRYTETVDAALAELGARAPAIRYAPPWHARDGFLDAVAARVEIELARLPVYARAAVTLVFTAHSVPHAMAADSPYVEEIMASASAIANRLGGQPWQVAYQSRSGNPRDPWLEPDVNDALRALAAAGAKEVVVVPIGFVVDHVEVLYDLDVEAKATARAAGLEMLRARTVEDHPRFIDALVEVVRETAA
jgi:ferrochelatase